MFLKYKNIMLAKDEDIISRCEVLGRRRYWVRMKTKKVIPYCLTATLSIEHIKPSQTFVSDKHQAGSLKYPHSLTLSINLSHRLPGQLFHAFPFLSSYSTVSVSAFVLSFYQVVDFELASQYLPSRPSSPQLDPAASSPDLGAPSQIYP